VSGNAPDRVFDLLAKLGHCPVNRRRVYAGTLGRKGVKRVRGLFALAKRTNNQNPGGLARNGNLQPQARSAIRTNTVSELATRPKAKPVTPAASDICPECRMDGGSKKGTWYAIGESKYCQDCAPAAARAAQVDIVAPAPTSSTTRKGGDSGSGAGRGRDALPLDPLNTKP
jgi:hypothetical protein